MELVGAIILGIFVSLVAGIATNEAYTWLPRIADRLINRAARRLPPEIRERYQEEWSAHSIELGNSIWRIVHALGCTSPSFRIQAIKLTKDEALEKLNEEWATHVADRLIVEVSKTERKLLEELEMKLNADRRAILISILKTYRDRNKQASIVTENFYRDLTRRNEKLR